MNFISPTVVTRTSNETSRPTKIFRRLSQIFRKRSTLAVVFFPVAAGVVSHVPWSVKISVACQKHWMSECPKLAFNHQHTFLGAVFNCNYNSSLDNLLSDIVRPLNEGEITCNSTQPRWTELIWNLAVSLLIIGLGLINMVFLLAVLFTETLIECFLVWSQTCSLSFFVASVADGHYLIGKLILWLLVG